MKINIFLLLIFLLLSFSVFAAKMNSTSYNQIVTISVGSENISSSSYRMGIAIGIINKVINSTSYINRLGFFHILLLANNQPCTSANQCEGGFCCSNLCKSSACPIEEAPTPSGGGGAGAAAGGGGGGGADIPLPITEEPKIKDFSLSQNSIKEHLALGTAKTKTITIKNTGNTALNFELSVITINDFVFLSENDFTLNSGQEKVLEINIIGKKLGSYFGEIEIVANGIKKSVNVVIEVESEQVLFDVKMDIPSAYKEVEAGKELKAQITLLNVGPARKVDVTTTYLIKDKLGNAIYEATETFAVEKQVSYVKSFKIPKELQPGGYIAIVEVRYENSFAVSSELFRVVPKEAVTQKIVKSGTAMISVLVIIIGLMFLFLYLLIPEIKIFRKR